MTLVTGAACCGCDTGIVNPSYTFIADLLNEIQVPEKGILSHTLYNDDGLKIVFFGFAPGQELTAHTAPMPATIQFLQGEAELTLGGDKREVKAGALIHMQPQLTHGIVARTPVLMLLYLHKSARQG
jgi:quercetin dioxygenase-like cupin family protein